MRPTERIRSCDPPHRAGVLALLAQCGLPTDGLADHWDTTWVAEDPSAPHSVIGSVALEVYGGAALLRSLAAREDQRSRGLGNALYEFAMSRARQLGVESVSLLTTTAEAFFSRRGFKVVRREELPEALRASAEFRGACPASAASMLKILL